MAGRRVWGPVSLSFVAVVSAARSAAQSGRLVSPPALANCATATFHSLPWGPFTSPESFVQTIHDDVPGPRLLRAMAFRHYWSQSYGPKTYQVKVTLADAATGSGGIRTTFASNHKTGGAATVVFQGVLAWPAFPAAPRPPSPFAAVVQFSTPHPHAGTDPLLCEVFVQSATPLGPTHYFEQGPSRVHEAGVLGLGCTAGGRTAPLDARGSLTLSTATGNLAFANALANGPGGAVSALAVGDASDRLGGTVPLPLDLGPFGSPGCFANINPLVSVGAMTTAAGAASLSFQFPLLRTVSGSRLRAQWLALDGATLKSSNGLDHAVCFNVGSLTAGNPWPAARVYANNFGPTPPPVGLALGVQGLVTEWRY